MGTIGAAWFDTALGRAALAWSDVGLTIVALPAADPSEAGRHVARHAAGVLVGPLDDAPEAARDAAVRCAAVLDGIPDDLRSLTLDLDGVDEFARAVYDHVRGVGPGATTTYGAVAAALGRPGAARAVGRALGTNPVPLVVPCHRVLAAGGALGGFSAPGGTATKRRMLMIEGAGVAAAAPTLFDL